MPHSPVYPDIILTYSGSIGLPISKPWSIMWIGGLCEFSMSTREVCSDDRKGKEDRFWCKDPRCTCVENAGRTRQEPGQLAAARLEFPLTSNEEIGQTLARLQIHSYYIPVDGSIEGTGSQPEYPSIRQSVGRLSTM